MLEELSGYLVQAPIAVILFVYIWLSDKQKNKIIQSTIDTNDKLIKLIEELTRKN